MKKRTLSLLLAVACALSLSGCGGAPAPPQNPRRTGPPIAMPAPGTERAFVRSAPAQCLQSSGYNAPASFRSLHE